MTEKTSDSIVNAVVEKILSRSAVGLIKYNKTLDRDDLSVLDWLNHLQEELMDAINYIEKLKNVLPTNTSNKSDSNDGKTV